MKITPYFEINELRYEIKRTRYLIAEYDKMREEVELSNEDRANATKVQSLIGDVTRYAEKLKELEEKFFETFDPEDERRYKAMKSLYDNTLAELTRLEVESGCTTRLQKTSIDILEQIAIKGLAEQYFDMNIPQATKIWEAYVDSTSESVAVEWLTAMGDCLFNDDGEEDENSFIVRHRQAREEQANRRRRAHGRK